MAAKGACSVGALLSRSRRSSSSSIIISSGGVSNMTSLIGLSAVAVAAAGAGAGLGQRAASQQANSAV